MELLGNTPFCFTGKILDKIGVVCENIENFQINQSNNLLVNTVQLFVNNKHDAQLFFMYVYFYYLNVSDSYVSIIRRINCITTTSGICHSEYE